MKSPRYLCIHGHFYQPPRENPWLDVVEVQDSAAPFHDWNERITRECYAPNTRARLVDGQGRIINLLNNYAWISFNFGPTLLSWMADHAPEVLRGIVEADRLSRERRQRARQCSGAGLQPYDHAPGQRARQADAGALGHRRFPPPLRPRSRGDVAGRDGRGTRLARGAGRGGDRGSRSWRRTRRADGGGSARRSWIEIPGGVDPSRAYLVPASVGPVDRPVLLRRHRLPSGRVRAAAGQRRAVPGTAPAGVRRPPRARPAHAHRHRRRVVRPPPPPRRHGPGLRAPAARARPDDPADQLRRVPRTAPARVGGRDPREERLELRPRRRAAGAPTAAARCAATGTRSGADRCAGPSTG